MSQDRAHPVGGVDDPRTIQEFDKWFSSERACIRYLQRVRWPDGFRGPACDGGNAWMTARGLLFDRLLQQVVEVDPVVYRRLVAGARRHNMWWSRE
ncbi:MAG: transposase [Terriglobia bacterium]